MKNTMTRKKTWGILGVILLLGVALRVIGLGNNSFVADEFLDINSSYGYFKTGEWQSWDFNESKIAEVNQNAARDERASIYKWQVAQLFSFLPPTEGAARMVSVVWGGVSIIALFFAGWLFSGKKTVGLIAAFLFSVSISGLEFDRRLRMYAMFFPIFLLMSMSLFAFYERAYKGKNRFFKYFWEKTELNWVYLVPLLFFGALSFWTHQLSVSIIPIFGGYVLWMILASWRKGEAPEDKYAATAALGLVATVVAFSIAPDRVKALLGTLVFFDNHYSYLRYVVRDFAHPLMGAFLFIFGSWYLLKKTEKKKEALWLLSSSLVPLGMAIWFWRRNEGQQYIFFAQSFMLLLVSVGAYGVIGFVKDEFSSRWKHAGLAALIALGVFLPNWGYFFWENNTYHETSSGTNPNYRKVFAYFKEKRSADDVLITRNFRNYYWSGEKVRVYDFGGELSESKLSVEEVQSILRDNPRGWFIASGNDMGYVSTEAKRYIEKNMERMSDSRIRGDILVYRFTQPAP